MQQGLCGVSSSCLVGCKFFLLHDEACRDIPEGVLAASVKHCQWDDHPRSLPFLTGGSNSEVECHCCDSHRE